MREHVPVRPIRSRFGKTERFRDSRLTEEDENEEDVDNGNLGKEEVIIECFDDVSR